MFEWLALLGKYSNLWLNFKNVYVRSCISHCMIIKPISMHCAKCMGLHVYLFTLKSLYSRFVERRTNDKQMACAVCHLHAQEPKDHCH